MTYYCILTCFLFFYLDMAHRELRGANTRILSDGLLIWYCPLVTNENHMGWEAYSQENYGHLIQRFLAKSEMREHQDAAFGLGGDARQLSPRQEEALETILNPRCQLHLPHDCPFHPEMWGIHGDGDTGEHEVMPEGSGPFLPIWQMSPVLPVEQLVNMDLGGH
jgi:hypothetical protein